MRPSSARTTNDLPSRRLSSVVILIALAGCSIGAMLASAPIKEFLLVLIGILAVLLPIIRPAYALYILFFAIVMMTDSLPKGVTDAFAIEDFDVIQGVPSALQLYVLLVIAVTASRQVVLRRKPPAKLTYLAIWFGVLAFAFWVGARNGWPPVEIRISFRNMALPVLAFYVCLAILDRRELVLNMTKLLLVAAVMKATILDVYFLFGRGVPFALFDHGSSRIVTNDSGDLMLFIGMVVLIFTAIASGQLRGMRRWVGSACLLPLLFAIVFSFRRAHWLGLFVSIALAVLWAGRDVRPRLLKPLLAGIVATLLLAPPLAVFLDTGGRSGEQVFQRISSLFDPEHSSNKYHVEETVQVFRELRSAPITGLGLGSHHAPITDYGAEDEPTHVVHNTFLYIWMKTGLPGLLLFCIVGIAYVQRIVRFLRRSTNSPEKTIVLAFGSLVGLLFVMAMTGPVPWYLHQTLMVALIAALVVSLTRASAFSSVTIGHFEPQWPAS